MAGTNLVVDGKSEEAIINGFITFMENAWAGRQMTMENRLHHQLLKELKANGNNVAMEIVEDEKVANIESLLQASKIGYFKAHTDKGTIFFTSAENGDVLQTILNIDAASRNDISRHFTSDSITSLASIDPKFEFVTFDDGVFTAEEDNISDIRIYQHGMVANTEGKATRIPATFLFNPKGPDFGTYLVDMSAQMSAKVLAPEYYEQKNAQIEYDKGKIKEFVSKIQMGEAAVLGNPRDLDGLSLQYRLNADTQKIELYVCNTVVTPSGTKIQEETKIPIEALSQEELINEVSFHAEQIYNMGTYDYDMWINHDCPESDRPKFTDSKFHDFLKNDFSNYLKKISASLSAQIASAYPDKSALEKANMEARLIVDDFKNQTSESAKILQDKFVERDLTEDDWKKFIELMEKNYEYLFNNEKIKDAETIAKEITLEKDMERTL